MDIKELKGQTFSVVISDHEDYVDFQREDGSGVLMLHRQDCCENVSIEDICGDLNDLVGVEIIDAYESSNHKDDGEYDNHNDCSHTWTFYHIRTIKGTVTIRWYGVSNGYYSEEANIYSYNTKEEKKILAGHALWTTDLVNRL